MAMVEVTKGKPQSGDHRKSMDIHGPTMVAPWSPHGKSMNKAWFIIPWKNLGQTMVH
jgi:hypothetical protein